MGLTNHTWLVKPNFSYSTAYYFLVDASTHIIPEIKNCSIIIQLNFSLLSDSSSTLILLVPECQGWMQLRQ